MILDCGHPEDSGHPASVVNKAGAANTVQGWTFALSLDGKRKLCHSCASKQVLDCGHPIGDHSYIFSGYGTDRNGKRHCFKCCGEMDKAEMMKTGKATLYLTGKPGEYAISNWPGTLHIHPYRASGGRHNIAGTRYDVWFSFEGKPWHGVQYGENTQICHCRRINGRA